MSAGGQNLANLILSGATIQADLIQKNGIYERSIFEQRSLARDQAIAQILAEKEAKKAERKARKKKNATLGIAAVATVLTAGAGAVLFAPAAAAGTLAAGASAAGAGFGAGAVGSGIGLGATALAVPSTAAIFTQGALQGFGQSFLGLNANSFTGGR